MSRKDTYNLATGKAITSLTPFSSPLEEYQAVYGVPIRLDN